MQDDRSYMKCSSSPEGLPRAVLPGVPTSLRCTLPAQDTLAPPWVIQEPQREAGMSHLLRTQPVPVAQVPLQPAPPLAPLPLQLQPPLQPHPLRQLPCPQPMLVDMVNRELVWCSAKTAQSCSPFQGCLPSRGSQQLPPVVVQGPPSMPCPPLGAQSPLVRPQSRLSPGLNNFSCSSTLPIVPPGLVNGPLGSGRSLQSGSVSIPRSGSGRFPQCAPGSALSLIHI